MASVYSQPFLTKVGATSGDTFVVPAGFVAVVRQVICYCNATGIVEFFVRNAAGGAIFWQHWDPATESFNHLEPRVVYEQGDHITTDVSVGAFDAVDYYVGGYLLG